MSLSSANHTSIQSTSYPNCLQHTHSMRIQTRQSLRTRPPSLIAAVKPTAYSTRSLYFLHHFLHSRNHSLVQNCVVDGRMGFTSRKPHHARSLHITTLPLHFSPVTQEVNANVQTLNYGRENRRTLLGNRLRFIFEIKKHRFL